MALRNIVTVGDNVLNKVCRPVTKFDKRLHMLLDDMADTLENAQGAGLAAPQVGVLRRVVLVDVGDENGYLELINPEIVARCFCHECAHLDGQLYTEVADKMLTPEELEEMLSEHDE